MLTVAIVLPGKKGRNWRCGGMIETTHHITAPPDEHQEVVGAPQTVLKVDGRLKGDDVEELAQAYRSAQGATALDLSELQSADRAGVELLRELASMGAAIRGASPYIELLMRTKS